MPNEKRRKNKGEVATPEMEARIDDRAKKKRDLQSFKALASDLPTRKERKQKIADLMKGEEERIASINTPTTEPPKQDDNVRAQQLRDDLLESEVNETYNQRRSLKSEEPVDELKAQEDARNYLSSLSLQELEGKAAYKRNQESQAQSNAIKNINNTLTVNTGAAKQEVVNAAVNDPDNTITKIDEARELGDEADDIVEEQTANDLSNANAQSKALQNLSTENKPQYDPNVDQLGVDVNKSIADAPTIAIEKLGVQDYYPTAGRNIAVGTFSGSRIGSQTIYSGAGGLLPMGLYDARQRAKEKAAKENLANVEKFLAVPDTYEVYQDIAKPLAAGVISDIAARNGWDYNSIMKDRDGIVMVNKIKGNYEKFSKAGTAAEGLKKQIIESKGEYYVPKEVRDELFKFTNAQMDPEEVKKYLTGNKNIGDITKSFISYPAGTKFIQDNLDKLTKNQTEIPLSVKTGKDLTAEDANKMKKELFRLQKMNADNDAYITLTRKYFSIDPSIMKTWADEQGLEADDKMIDMWTDYLMKVIPEESIIPKIETIVNNAADRAIERDKLKVEKEKFGFQKQQAQTEHQRIQDAMNKNNYQAEVFGTIKAYVGGDISTDSFNTLISNRLSDAGLSTSSDENGNPIGIRPLTTKTKFAGLGNENTYIQVNGIWEVPENIIGNPKYSAEDQEAAKSIIDNRGAIETDQITYRPGYRDESGVAHNLTSKSAKNAVNYSSKLYGEVSGNLNMPFETFNDETKETKIDYRPSKYKVKTVGIDVNSTSGQTFLDQVTGSSGSSPGKTTKRESSSSYSSSSE